MSKSRPIYAIAVAASFAMLMAGCGGGGGSGGTRPSTGSMPPSSTETEFASLNPTNAGYVTTAASRAADARPRSGSITQSSNVNNGITVDRVSVTAQHGVSGNSYSIRNGSSWSISTRDGNPVQLDSSGLFDGQELYKRTNGGTLYVDVYSDIAAPETTTTTTTVPGQSQDIGSGDRIIGLSCLGPGCDASTQEGTLNGVNGTFSCPSGCSIQFGGLSLSSGSNISFEGATFNGLRVGVDEFRVTSATGVTFTPAQMTQPTEQTTPDTDYLAGGVWLFIPDSATSADDVVFGAFGDGSDPFRQSNLMALQGTARYSGGAAGIYSQKVYSGAEPTAVGYFDAEVSLTANFGGRNDFGMINGSLDHFNVDGEPLDGTLILGNANIGSSNSGFFRGSVSDDGASDSRKFTGQWGGQFFGNEEADGKPSSVGGTFGARSTDIPEVVGGGEISIVGAFGAHKQ